EKKPEENQREYLHRGIAQRSFERRFQLADYVEVTGASLTDGLLHIELVRNLPEQMRPRVIPIGTPERAIEADVSKAGSQTRSDAKGAGASPEAPASGFWWVRALAVTSQLTRSGRSGQPGLLTQECGPGQHG